MKFETSYYWIFGATWYFFTITTYGTNVPAGLFLPGMIIGCALGNLYALYFNEIFHFDINSDTE